MQFDEIYFVQRIVDTRHFVRLLASHASRAERVNARITKTLVPQFLIVCLGLFTADFVGKRVRFHEFVIVVVRTIRHTHRVRAAPDAGHLDARQTFACRLFQFRETGFGAKNRRRRAIAHHANVETREGPRDHRRIPHVFDRQTLVLLRVWIVERIHVILDRHRRQLFDRRAELFHVARHHHRVIAGIKSADRIIETHIAGERDEFVALPRLDVRHRFESVRDADIHRAGRDRFPRFLKANAARRAAAFDTMSRLGAQTEIILCHDACHQLAAKVVGKIRRD